MNRKGFAPIIIIIALAVAVIAGGVVVYLKSNLERPKSKIGNGNLPTSPVLPPLALPSSTAHPSPTTISPSTTTSPRPVHNSTVTPTSTARGEGTPAYTLVAYTGQVFGAKVPRGWNVTSNQSGVEIIDFADNDTGVSGVVAVGWWGKQTPDGFIDFLLQAIGACRAQTKTSK